MKNVLLFIAPVDLLDAGSGVTQKVKNQYKVFCRHMKSYLAAFEGNDVVVYCDEECISRNDDHSKRRLARLLDMKSFIETNYIDALYIRYMLALPQLITLLWKTKRLIKHAAIEVPDYPYRKKLIKRKEYIQLLVDCCFAPYLRNNIGRIFVCSDNSRILGIEAEQLKNGTDIGQYNLRAIDEETDEINILSISTMGAATAVDRFINGLGEYYANHGCRSVKLHLVGNGPGYENYMSKIKFYGIESKVIVYGYLTRSETKGIYDKCDIGLGAIGFNRVGIKNDSTLKSREYGLCGMPIIAENKIDLLDNDYPYVMYCAYDDSSVDINAVIKFYDKCFAQKSKKEVANEIRAYFVDRCDINKTMKPIIDYFLA